MWVGLLGKLRQSWLLMVQLRVRCCVQGVLLGLFFDFFILSSFGVLWLISRWMLVVLFNGGILFVMSDRCGNFFVMVGVGILCLFWGMLLYFVRVGRVNFVLFVDCMVMFVNCCLYFFFWLLLYVDRKYFFRGLFVFKLFVSLLVMRELLFCLLMIVQMCFVMWGVCLLKILISRVLLQDSFFVGLQSVVYFGFIVLFFGFGVGCLFLCSKVLWCLFLQIVYCMGVLYLFVIWVLLRQ